MADGEIILERLAVLEIICKKNQESLGILFKSIEGNGQPGLKRQLAELEAEHRQCMKMRQEAKQPKQWPSVVSAICAIGALVVVLIKM